MVVHGESVTRSTGLKCRNAKEGDSGMRVEEWGTRSGGGEVRVVEGTEEGEEDEEGTKRKK